MGEDADLPIERQAGKAVEMPVDSTMEFPEYFTLRWRRVIPSAVTLADIDEHFDEPTRLLVDTVPLPWI